MVSILPEEVIKDAQLLSAIAITNPWISGAASVIGLAPLLNGNNRGADFDAGFDSDSFKSFQDITVTADPEVNLLVKPQRRKWGKSTAYFNDSGTPVDGKPYWWWQLTQPSTAPRVDDTLDVTRNNNIVLTRKPTDSVVQMDFKLSGGIPFLGAIDVGNTTISGAPRIDANIQVLIEQQKGKKAQYLITGAHDGFPAYELYINEELVYFYDPAIAGKTPFALSLPFDVIVAENLSPVWRTIGGNENEAVRAQSNTTFTSTRTNIETGFKNEIGQSFSQQSTTNLELASEPEFLRDDQPGTHFYALYNLYSGQVEQRGVTEDGLKLQNLVIAPNTPYQILLLQPETNWGRFR